MNICAEFYELVDDLLVVQLFTSDVEHGGAISPVSLVDSFVVTRAAKKRHNLTIDLLLSFIVVLLGIGTHPHDPVQVATEAVLCELQPAFLHDMLDDGDLAELDRLL